ncbi:MAG TPA: S53 family peptidase, partial [Candidatus Angelobacter sp.]
MVSKITAWPISFAVLIFTTSIPSAIGQTPRPATPQIVPRIISPIDDSIRVKVTKSTNPLTKAASDMGHLDGSTMLERMILVLGSSPEQDHRLQTFLDSQHSKGSPDYHHWLTPEEFGQQFGPSSQDVTQIQNWLKQHGFTIGIVARSGRWMEFSGTVTQVEETFQTSMRQYLLAGKLHIANDGDISIPKAVSPVVQGVLSLHSFHSKPMTRRSARNMPVTLATDGSGEHFMTPGDLATIYGLTSLFKGTSPSPAVTPITGTGQTIAIVGAGDINTMATTGVDDVGNFRALFGLPPNPPKIISNGPAPGLLAEVSDEATLDVEYAGAAAPGATIELVVSAETVTTDAIALSSSFIVDQNLAPIMSLSFGECEKNIGPQGNAFWNALWQQAAAQGISVFVASADTGAAGCEPNAPSLTAASGGLEINGFGSTPFDTAVGGTEFDEGAAPSTFWGNTNGPGFTSAIGYIPEKVWNDSCTPADSGSFCQQVDFFDFSSSGGGISKVYTVPSYQTLPIQGLTGQNFPSRAIPDVSLASANAHDPYLFCFTVNPAQPDCQVSGQNVTFQNVAGGTSFASPEFAGIMALINQATGDRQGLANYVLYALAATESSSFSSCNSSN